MHTKPYWNPYIAGVALGLVLLATFLISGGGLGATALPKRTVALVGSHVAPTWTAENPAVGHYLQAESNPLKNWLVVEVVGMALGGFLGALSAGRFKTKVEMGPRTTVRRRLAFALGGGVVMGIAAGIARGCTSGQALSGGASLAAGSWLFMTMVFAGGYAVAWFLRREWT
jgi:hypothetical protein